MRAIQKMNTITRVMFVLITFAFMSCSDDENVSPEGARFVDLPSNLVTSYDGVLQYNVNQVPQVTESDATATVSKTGDKVYKVSFSDGVPEVTGLRFIENNGTFASASDSGSSEGVSLRLNDLSVGIRNGDKHWQFSTPN